MSERSKGDTSSSVAAPPTSARVVKNPLLSASVTFDDFSNKPLLLPAAPPIIHPVPIVSSRESTPLVTVGKSSEIDSENLSEVNLNDFSGAPTSSNTDVSDENSNTLLEPTVPADNSILSQAATSFSQLPSVASSVFSTFSKKFNSAREDINSNPGPQLDIQPFSTQFVNQAASPIQVPPPPPSGFGNQEQQATAPPQDEPQVPIDPPTFYSPSEVPSVPSGVPCPPAGAGQNTYRISARKKIYAPIPGLSSTHQAEQNPPPAAATASFLPPIGFEASPVPIYAEQVYNKPEERKGGGLFSLSSLVPGVPNVLQNLSGLVQSAAGSLSIKTPESVQQPPTDSFNSFQVDSLGNASPPNPYSTGNFFGLDQSTQQAHVYQPPPPVNFFTPPVGGTIQPPTTQSTVPDQVGNFFATIQPTSGSSLVNFAEPPQSTGIQFPAPPPKSSTSDVNPAVENFSSESAAPPPVRPPSGGPPSTSFRLQKGTRLYKSPFAAAPSSGYPSAPQSIIPLSQPTADIFSHFNPLQQEFVPRREETSSTVLTPPKVSEAISQNLPKEGIIPDPNSSVFQPNQAPSQENSFSNQLNTKPLAVPLDKTSEQRSKQATPPPVENSLTIHSANVSAPAIPDKQETLSVVELSFQEQINLGQSILLPPPPAVASGIATPSKETANFPPPPPQNSFQNAANSNPYRRGLHTHHSQLPSIAPSSTIFNPNDKDVNLFSPLETETAKPASEGINQFQPTREEPTKALPQDSNTFKPIEAELSKPESHQENNLFKPIATEPIQESPQGIGIFQAIATDPVPQGIHPLNPIQTESVKPTSEGINIFQPIVTEVAKPLTEDLNSFKPIATVPVNPLSEGPTSIAAFFVEASTTEVHSNPYFASETSKVSEESSALIASSSTDSASDKLASETPPQVDTQQPTLASDIFNPISAVPSFSPSKKPEPTSAAGPHSSVEAFFTPTSEVKVGVDVKSATPTPASALVSFFQGTSTLSDPFVLGKVTQTQSPSKDIPKTDQLPASVPAISGKIASPPKSQENSESQQSVPNLFTNFFETAVPTAVTPVINQPSLPDPTSFFDSFGQVPSVGVDAPPPEDPNSQRIQNFFNNPPPKDLDPVGDLNYNLVGSGLSVKNLQTRSLTPASNLVEPPSSSCSEFSELNSSLSAANRQPRPPADDSNKISPEEEPVPETANYSDLPEDIINEIRMANSTVDSGTFTANMAYKPAAKHWFFKRKLDAKNVWSPFPFYDSERLEEAFLLGEDGPNLVAVEGGRYDVNISERIKVPVYWEGDPIEVKRCSWFYKASDSKYVPYEEEIADLLEEEYRKASESCEWHKKIPISAGDMVVFHGPTVIVHFQQQQQVDSWGGSTVDTETFFSYIQQQTTSRPRVVKRDLEDFTIEEGESHRVDHILFMVHGIGSACDLKMRSVEEVVDEFRAIALQLVQSHYKNSVENGYVGRVEVLPVSWHSELHSDEFGIDEKLKSITLESIPKLRNFTNDTLLDILFYTSPMFCQRIMNTVTASMNSVFVKYKQRNPDFHGGVSLAGHSLGSLILFDLLCHQRPLKVCEEQNMENPDEITPGYPVDSNQLNEDAASHISYKMGPAGTGQPFISYPQLIFQPKTFFALGSPIGMFVTIRGIDKLGLDFRLPTCPGFFNIFHPYDPVAYRLEALVNPDMNGIPPVLIPHHKGRKRMHLELKETMSRVGADLKQRFFDTFKTTIDSVSFLAPRLRSDPKELEKEVDKVLNMQQEQNNSQQGASTSRSRADSNSTNQSDTDIIEIDFPLGKLNDSKRIDYVLQEAPLEFFNEYVFAFSSHVCYWESEDTILFVMKEIYSRIGFSPDSQVPQQTMTIERPSSSGSMTRSPTS